MFFPALLAQLPGDSNQVQDIDRPITVDIRLWVGLTKVLTHQNQVQDINQSVTVEVITRLNDNLVGLNVDI